MLSAVDVRIIVALAATIGFLLATVIGLLRLQDKINRIIEKNNLRE